MLIVRNAHAITRCVHIIRVRKSAHLNGIIRTFPPGRWLASAIATEDILNDSEPLGSGRPLSGCRYFQSAIVEVQAHGHVMLYHMWLIFMDTVFLGSNYRG